MRLSEPWSKILWRRRTSVNDISILNSETSKLGRRHQTTKSPVGTCTVIFLQVPGAGIVAWRRNRAGLRY